MSASDAPRRVCAVCARVLAAVHLDGEWRYEHGLIDAPADHPAVPVPADQVHALARCDFCTDDDPGWVVPAHSFYVEDIPAASGGAWAACDRCATLVGRNEWSALRRRALDVMWRTGRLRGLDPNQIAATLDRAWRQLRPHITGPPIPLRRDR